jgi:hypothetical protein
VAFETERIPRQLSQRLSFQRLLILALWQRPLSRSGGANGAGVPLDLKPNVDERNYDGERADHLRDITPVLKVHRSNETEITHRQSVAANRLKLFRNGAWAAAKATTATANSDTTVLVFITVRN